MDLSLSFPEFSNELALRSQSSLDAVVSHFRAALHTIHHQPAADGIYAEIPSGVDLRLRAALERRGILRLYSHQAESFEAIQSNRNVVVVTPTASGKTLCY